MFLSIGFFNTAAINPAMNSISAGCISVANRDLFKWIKQHLRIKKFFGTSENAVKTPIWISILAYVLVAIMKKRLKIELTLYTILQILSISLFEKKMIYQALTETNYRNRIDSLISI